MMQPELAIPEVLGWLLTYAIHSTVLLAVAWIISTRTRSHQLREAIWKIAMVGGFVTASLQRSLDVTPLAGRVTVTRAAPVVPEQAVEPVIPVLETATPNPVSTTPATDSGIALGDWLVAAWAGLSLVLLLGYAVRRAVWNRRLSGRRPVMTHPLAELLESLAEEAGITRPIRLSVSPALASPIALGRSEIAVPEAALTELDPAQQRGMLAHELAHLERRDPAWLTAACVIERIGFFQPLNRLARRRIQECAEYLCDEWAVRRTGTEGGHSLASCLAKVAEWLEAAPAIPLAGMAEERSHLVGRVRRLLEGAPFSSGPGRRTLLAGGALAVAAAIIAIPAVSTGRPVSPQDSDSQTGVEGFSGERQDSVKAVVRALMVAAKDPEVEVRRAALQSLARYQDPSTIPAFREALRDPDVEIRTIAIEALGEFKDRASVSEIAALLRDENVDVRRRAADALDELPARGVMDQLIAAMKDEDAEVRHNVIGVLANLKDPAAVGPLVAALQDPKPEVRARAIEALHELDLPNPPAGLLEALRDNHPEVRHEAAHAVGHYKDVRAVPVLRAMLDDPNGEVREAAVEALSEIRNEEALQALMTALKSKDPKVRKAAAEALGQQ